ncbi:MAG: hypothetical protein ACTTKD_10400 [Peptoanaerobacter stomatis]|uniref:hypothetical protein n=1 Tax=Peptoanaerobacter stomatis TaxID=796937 RepID=UPI003F9FC8ED
MAPGMNQGVSKVFNESTKKQLKKEEKKQDYDKILINRLCESLLVDSKNFNTKDTIEILKALNDNNIRILYSMLTNTVYSCKKEQVGIMTTNLDKLKDKSQDVEYNIKKYIIKVYDHVNLAIKQQDMFYEKAKGLKEEIIKESIAPLENKIISSAKDEIRDNKVDIIALTTLIFSVFTVISLNVTIFAATLEKVENIYQSIRLLFFVNVILIITIFCIYAIIRKIHGDIENKQLYLIIGLCLLLLICIFIVSEQFYKGYKQNHNIENIERIEKTK